MNEIGESPGCFDLPARWYYNVRSRGCSKNRAFACAATGYVLYTALGVGALASSLFGSFRLNKYLVLNCAQSLLKDNQSLSVLDVIDSCDTEKYAFASIVVAVSILGVGLGIREIAKRSFEKTVNCIPQYQALESSDT